MLPADAADVALCSLHLIVRGRFRHYWLPANCTKHIHFAKCYQLQMQGQDTNRHKGQDANTHN